MQVDFEYFYGNETEQFSFYRIPKILFKDKLFKDVSAEAKILYGLMLDRTGLSVKNGWIDEDSRVYIVYTIAEIMEDMNCADQKVGKLLSELDTVKGIGLIERKRQGLGKPNIIYVKNFFLPSQMQNRENHESRKVKITNQGIFGSRIKKSENHDSGKVNFTIQESPKSLSNDNNINNNDFNDTTILSYQEEGQRFDSTRWMGERETYAMLIKKNIEYEILITKYRKEWLDEIVAIMLDVICSNESYIRVNKQDYPQEIVKNRFLKISSSHIEYIYDALKDNTSNVRNIRAFLITTIYRSFETADNWYMAKVNYDQANPNLCEDDV